MQLCERNKREYFVKVRQKESILTFRRVYVGFFSLYIFSAVASLIFLPLWVKGSKFIEDKRFIFLLDSTYFFFRSYLGS